MKKITTILLLFSAQLFSNLLFAQDFSAATKLQYYAGACNAAQIEVLLKNDTTFDIYDTGVTNSPVMVAIERYISANNAQNAKSCTECRMSIETIMRDNRYKWKSAIGAVASKGLRSTFCYLLESYPILKFSLDKRPNEQHYPAIMLASAYNNLEMVKALASNGSDYYLKVSGFGKFPSEEIATQQGLTEISAYLNRRRLGNEPVTKNPICAE